MQEAMPSTRTTIWRERALTAMLRRGLLPQRQGDGERALILLFNSSFGYPVFEEPPGGLPAAFELTNDLRRFDEAGVVVFHTPTLGSLKGLHKPPGQVWVDWRMESAINFPRLEDHSLSERFDLTASYQQGADLFISYLDLLDKDEKSLRSQPKPKEGVATLFMSGPGDASGRIGYATELMRHMEIDSFGRRLRNKQLAVDEGSSTKMSTIARYKFTLAFENAIEPDYVTEKFYEPLIAGSVPVYLGAPNVAELAPAPDSYIDVRDFESPRALADRLRELDRDLDAYAAYLDWKTRPFDPRFQRLMDTRSRHPLLRLCDLVSAERSPA